MALAVVRAEVSAARALGRLLSAWYVLLSSSCTSTSSALSSIFFSSRSSWEPAGTEQLSRAAAREARKGREGQRGTTRLGRGGAAPWLQHSRTGAAPGRHGSGAPRVPRAAGHAPAEAPRPQPSPAPPVSGPSAPTEERFESSRGSGAPPDEQHGSAPRSSRPLPPPSGQLTELQRLLVPLGVEVQRDQPGLRARRTVGSRGGAPTRAGFGPGRGNAAVSRGVGAAYLQSLAEESPLLRLGPLDALQAQINLMGAERAALSCPPSSTAQEGQLLSPLGLLQVTPIPTAQPAAPCRHSSQRSVTDVNYSSQHEGKSRPGFPQALQTQSTNLPAHKWLSGAFPHPQDSPAVPEQPKQRLGFPSFPELLLKSQLLNPWVWFGSSGCSSAAPRGQPHSPAQSKQRTRTALQQLPALQPSALINQDATAAAR